MYKIIKLLLCAIVSGPLGEDFLIHLHAWRRRSSYLFTSALVRPNLEYAIYLKKDINHLERIQRAATRWVKGLRGLTYEEWLKVLKVPPLKKRSLWNGLVQTDKILYNSLSFPLQLELHSTAHWQIDYNISFAFTKIAAWIQSNLLFSMTRNMFNHDYVG